MTSSISRRDPLPDALRGFAAILVIAGHLIARDGEQLAMPYYFKEILSSFHMPLFFFFGGYFAHKALKAPFLTLVRQKAVRFLLPYVMWSTVAVAAKVAVNILRGGYLLQEALRLWLDTLLYAESLWFFIALFISYVIGWLLLKLLDRYGYWALLLPAVLVCLPGSPVFAWHNTQEMLPFFVFGLLFTRGKVSYDTHRLQTVRWRYILLLLAAVILVSSPLYVAQLRSLNTASGPVMLLLVAGELLITAAAIVVLTEFFYLCAPLKRFFLWLGQYTMELYCIHMFFVKYLMVVTPAWVLPLPQALSSVYYFAVSTGIGIVCALLSRWILDRIPLFRMFMLGQWPAKQRKSDVPESGVRLS